MSRTVRLFDLDSHLFTFEATILACESAGEDRYAIVLDRTAFFPEGGGQYADVGTLNGQPVLDVQEKEDGSIQHFLSCPLPEGNRVVGQLDPAIRLRRMQNHTGEHILSGLIFKHHGFHNVGFHLGHGDVTMDLDGVLSREQLDEIEREANRAVYACIPVKAYYPSYEELAELTYRSKESLSNERGEIRIVKIEGYDCCACCAPHVFNTGEIGLIKILDFIHYKGGVRLHILCGLDALEDYRWRYAAIRSMANTLSIKQNEIVEGLDKVLTDLESARYAMRDLRQRMWQQRLDTLPFSNAYLCLFDDAPDTQASARRIVTQAAENCRLWCGLFVGNDTDGYRYTLGKGTDMDDIRDIALALNKNLKGRGGGSADMVQGQLMVSRSEIEAFVDTLMK